MTLLSPKNNFKGGNFVNSIRRTVLDSEDSISPRHRNSSMSKKVKVDKNNARNRQCLLKDDNSPLSSLDLIQVRNDMLLTK